MAAYLGSRCHSRTSHFPSPSFLNSDHIKQTLCYPLNSFVHTRPLLIALTYVTSKLSPPGTQTSIFGLITIPVAYYPYLMVGMDLLMGGPTAAAIGVTGLIVGHGWWWGIYGGAGRRGSLEEWGRAPAWMNRLVSNGGGTIGGVHVIPPRTRADGSSSGSATATGYQWGSGRRLGQN